MKALAILLLTLTIQSSTQAGLKPLSKNYFKSCWCQKQRQCQNLPENWISYTDPKRNLEYQCQNCQPSQLTERRTKTPLALQIDKIAATQPRSCIRGLSQQTIRK